MYSKVYSTCKYSTDISSSPLAEAPKSPELKSNASIFWGLFKILTQERGTEKVAGRKS